MYARDSRSLLDSAATGSAHSKPLGLARQRLFCGNLFLYLPRYLTAPDVKLVIRVFQVR